MTSYIRGETLRHVRQMFFEVVKRDKTWTRALRYRDEFVTFGVCRTLLKPHTHCRSVAYIRALRLRRCAIGWRGVRFLVGEREEETNWWTMGDILSYEDVV